MLSAYKSQEREGVSAVIKIRRGVVAEEVVREVGTTGCYVTGKVNKPIAALTFQNYYLLNVKLNRLELGCISCTSCR